MKSGFTPSQSKNQALTGKSNKMFRQLFESMSEGCALHRVIYDDQGNPADYLVVDINLVYETILGLEKDSVIGKKASEIYGGKEAPYLDIYSRVASSGKPYSFETYFPPMKKHFNISVFSPEKGYFATVFSDITGRKRVEDDLRESERRFRSLFEAHQAVMLLIDPENSWIVDANPAAAQFYGYPRAVLKTMKITDINQMPPDRVGKEMNKSLRKRRNQFIFPHRLSSGEIRTVEVYSSPISMRDRPILFSIIHDVTERKRAEEALRASEKRYSRLFESMDEGFALCEMIYDKEQKPIDFRYLMVNPAYSILTGLPVEKVVGSTVKKVLPDMNPVWIETYDQIVKSGISRRIDRPAPELRKHFDVYAWRTTPGRFAILFNDITEHKKMEKQIKNLYKKERNQRKKVQEEAKIKNIFIDVLAHELRNPLSSILASSGMLKDTPEISGPIRQRLAANINNGAEALAKRLDELLDVARFSKGIFKLQKEPFEAQIFMREVAERFKPALTGKGQVLDLRIIGQLPVVVADRSRLEQVIVNLLSNASKYSPEKSLISITTGIKYKKLSIEIKDQGTGITEEDQKNIFQAYHRVGKTGQTPGTGLGLYISKQIVKAHGGRIQVTSQPGKGSTFNVLIPLKSKAEEGLTH